LHNRRQFKDQRSFKDSVETIKSWIKHSINRISLILHKGSLRQAIWSVAISQYTCHGNFHAETTGAFALEEIDGLSLEQLTVFNASCETQ